MKVLRKVERTGLQSLRLDHRLSKMVAYILVTKLLHHMEVLVKLPCCQQFFHNEQILLQLQKSEMDVLKCELFETFNSLIKHKHRICFSCRSDLNASVPPDLTLI